MAKTPATRQWSELRTDALNIVGLPDSTRAQAIAYEAMREAVRKLNANLWRARITYQDITTTASTVTYDLNADFRDARTAILLNSSDQPVGRLYSLDRKTFEQEFPSRDTGSDPTHYSIYDNTANYVLELSSIPSAAWVGSYPKIRLWYYAAVQYLVGSPDSFGAQGVTAEMEQFVQYWMQYALCKIWFPSYADRARRDAEVFLEELIRTDNKFGFRDWE